MLDFVWVLEPRPVSAQAPARTWPPPAGNDGRGRHAPCVPPLSSASTTGHGLLGPQACTGPDAGTTGAATRLLPTWFPRNTACAGLPCVRARVVGRPTGPPGLALRGRRPWALQDQPYGRPRACFPALVGLVSHATTADESEAAGGMEPQKLSLGGGPTRNVSLGAGRPIMRRSWLLLLAGQSWAAIAKASAHPPMRRS